jgi:hypothetical protein
MSAVYTTLVLYLELPMLFLIEIYLCGITATPPNKEITKTALGATETVTWEHNESVLEVIEKLKKPLLHSPLSKWKAPFFCRILK